MTVRLAGDGTITLEDICQIEDAEKLQQYLLSDPAAPVDWRSCTAAHTAVVQILLASRPVVIGPPAGDWLKLYLDPLMSKNAPDSPAELAQR